MHIWLNLLSALSRLAVKQGHRQVVILAGEQEWAWQKISPWLNNQPNNIIISTDCPTHFNGLRLKTNKPNTLLGYESQNIVFNAHDGLYPDALTAISGTLQAGGLFFLLCPPLKQWPKYSDDFANKRSPFNSHKSPNPVNNCRTINRLIDKATLHGAHIHEQNFEAPSKPAIKFEKDVHKQSNWHTPTELTADQQQVLTDISASFTAKQPFCHVITSDRGRGKSHLVGKLILEHIRTNLDNGINYYICAPTKAASVATYKVLNESQQLMNRVNLAFVAPEDVLGTVKENDVLIIDEAASLPMGFLIKCSIGFNKIVFASTTHGYEGTGKGFQIRFFKHLNSPSCHHKPQYHTINTPVRYAQNDPLENWLFDAFCLDSEPSEAPYRNSLASGASTELLSQDRLTNNEGLLKEVFGLLIQAHYQTRPSDLRDILDAPDFKLFGLFSQSQGTRKTLLSVCLISIEGPIFDTENQQDIQQAILKGVRRPKGHLMPQVLSHHLAIKEALNLTGARIVRIATPPNFQNTNLASQLLTQLSEKLRYQGIDYLGSSFANTPDVSAFWSKNGFSIVRVGSKQDGASGTHSAMVLKGLSSLGIALHNKALEIYQSSQNTIQTKDDLSAHENLQLSLFTQHMGSYESAKQILSRCHKFPYPFPKKAHLEFKQQVKAWLEVF